MLTTRTPCQGVEWVRFWFSLGLHEWTSRSFSDGEVGDGGVGDGEVGDGDFQRSVQKRY